MPKNAKVQCPKLELLIKPAEMIFKRGIHTTVVLQLDRKHREACYIKRYTCLGQLRQYYHRGYDLKMLIEIYIPKNVWRCDLADYL
jgi:hypothetical protein